MGLGEKIAYRPQYQMVFSLNLVMGNLGIVLPLRPAKLEPGVF